MLPKDQLAVVLKDKFRDNFIEITEFRGMLTIHIRGEEVESLLTAITGVSLCKEKAKTKKPLT